MSKATDPDTIRADRSLSDPWLDRWLGLIGQRVAGLPLLELGCGGGRDTEVLVAAGHRVVAIDLSPRAVAHARVRVPTAEFHCQDIRAPWPLTDVGVVVASLSLHYFAWAETELLVQRIREILRPAGVLLCRLNSINDHHHGASGHPSIDENFYLVDGVAKRFFDRPAVDRLFAASWRLHHVEEQSVDRYVQPKVAWEIVAEKST